jgi:hypothetical protein
MIKRHEFFIMGGQIQGSLTLIYLYFEMDGVQ